jgi:hypothetical protein
LTSPELGSLMSLNLEESKEAWVVSVSTFLAFSLDSQRNCGVKVANSAMTAFALATSLSFFADLWPGPEAPPPAAALAPAAFAAAFAAAEPELVRSWTRDP